MKIKVKNAYKKRPANRQGKSFTKHVTALRTMAIRETKNPPAIPATASGERKVTAINPTNCI